MKEEKIVDKLINSKISTGIDFQKVAIDYGFKILGSIIIILIGLLAIKIITKIINIAFDKLKVDSTLSTFLIKLIKIILFIFVILAALNNLGVETTSFVALFTATSFAISFAFKETLSNIAAGVLIIVFRPFRLNDYVKCGAGEGYVAEISLFSLTLRMYDNTNIIIPNSKVISDNIYNYSREKIRRIDYLKNIQASELNTKRTEIKNALKNNEFILKNPDITIGVTSINEADITISIQIWVNNDNYEKALLNTNEIMSNIFLEN